MEENNIITDGDTAALYTVLTAYTVYTVKTVYTVNTVNTIETALHYLNSSMHAYLYIVLRLSLWI